MMLQLIVKGNEAQARTAAEAHGIPVSSLSEGTHTCTVYVRATEEDGHVRRVVGWFVETGCAPYPPGSLLLYASGPDRE